MSENTAAEGYTTTRNGVTVTFPYFSKLPFKVLDGLLVITEKEKVNGIEISRYLMKVKQWDELAEVCSADELSSVFSDWAEASKAAGEEMGKLQPIEG